MEQDRKQTSEAKHWKYRRRVRCLFTTAAKHFQQGGIQPATPEPRYGDVRCRGRGQSHAEPSESEESSQGHMESRDTKIRDVAKGVLAAACELISFSAQVREEMQSREPDAHRKASEEPSSTQSDKKVLQGRGVCHSSRNATTNRENPATDTGRGWLRQVSEAVRRLVGFSAHSMENMENVRVESQTAHETSALPERRTWERRRSEEKETRSQIAVRSCPAAGNGGLRRRGRGGTRL